MAVICHRIKIPIEHANRKLDGDMMYTVYHDRNSLIQVNDIIHYIPVDKDGIRVINNDIEENFYTVTSIVQLKDGDIVFGDKEYDGNRNN